MSVNELLCKRGILNGLGVARHGKQIYPEADIKICTPRRRATSAAKEKVTKMATKMKAVKPTKPAGKASGKAATKPKAKAKK